MKADTVAVQTQRPLEVTSLDTPNMALQSTAGQCWDRDPKPPHLCTRHCRDFPQRHPTGHAEQHPLSMKRCLTMIISGLFAAKKTPSIMDANLHAPCRWCDERRYNLRLHWSGTSADQGCRPVPRDAESKSLESAWAKWLQSINHLCV